ncbi:Zn-ribbon domain-containing OB-fold protein [Dietzia psychralcaliphila]|uniref:Zn-ribbon domain-containing OB-fold protein n=1 Tax=Dietzia psychralcaliphila TaxID=139021 RepID=UPI001C1DFAB7|nr:OB-fold domain-containing protein [Dietzia psychralcaliphila]
MSDQDRDEHDIRVKFWNSCREGILRIQWCQECDKWQFYPRYLCRHCGSRAVEWREAAGIGTVETFSIVNRAEGIFAELTPYVVALVRLSEGPTMMTNVVGTTDSPLNVATVSIGMPVRVLFEERDGQVLPLFTPVSPDTVRV